MQRTPNFLDYIQEGCDLTFSVAVDFTASNKSIQDPASLHHIAEGVLNQYQQAIMAVGPIGENEYSHCTLPVTAVSGQLCLQLAAPATVGRL